MGQTRIGIIGCCRCLHQQVKTDGDAAAVAVGMAGDGEGVGLAVNSKGSVPFVLPFVPFVLPLCSNVVGLRLGCLSHALLTAQSITAHGLKNIGWVGNSLSTEMGCATENIATLKQRMPGDCLGIVPFEPQSSLENITRHLNISSLL